MDAAISAEHLAMAEELLAALGEKRSQIYEQIGASMKPITMDVLKQAEPPQVIEVVDPEPKAEQKLTTEQRFNILKGWAKEQGCVGLENIRVPAEFSDDFCAADKNFSYTGVEAAVDIHHRKPVMGAPFSTLISPKTF